MTETLSGLVCPGITALPMLAQEEVPESTGHTDPIPPPAMQIPAVTPPQALG